VRDTPSEIKDWDVASGSDFFGIAWIVTDKQTQEIVHYERHAWETYTDGSGQRRRRTIALDERRAKAYWSRLLTADM
jgi:hypothetical protein